MDLIKDAEWDENERLRVLHRSAHELNAARNPEAMAMVAADLALRAVAQRGAARISLSAPRGRPPVSLGAEDLWSSVGGRHFPRRRAALREGTSSRVRVGSPPGWAIGLLPLVAKPPAVGILEVLATESALVDGWFVLEVLAAQTAIALANLEELVTLRRQFALADQENHDSPRHGDEPAAGLTPREKEILLLLTEGATTRAIAATLHIAPNTVRSHVQALFTKLEVHSRLGAVALATRRGLVADPSATVTPVPEPEVLTAL